MAPTYLSDCLPTTIGETVTYNLSNKDDYRTQRCRLQTSSKSFFPSTVKLWNSLPDSVKSLPTFSKFKKPFSLSKFRWLHFTILAIGKLTIHTKLRHRCSDFNADLHRVNLKNNPRCVCGHLFEDAIHSFLECPLYQHDRTSLFNYFNNIVAISIENILFGCNEISEELNTLLFKSVQTFIRQTCRFNN